MWALNQCDQCHYEKENFGHTQGKYHVKMKADDSGNWVIFLQVKKHQRVPTAIKSHRIEGKYEPAYSSQHSEETTAATSILDYYLPEL